MNGPNRTWLILGSIICLAWAGCETAFDRRTTRATDTGEVAAATEDNSSEVSGGGEFADVGPDRVDVRPEVEVIEEEGEETASHFRAIQIDPTREDTAGPKFVRPYDADNDGLMDLISAWNQSQPVQLHLQRRDAAGSVIFTTVNLGGTYPIAVIAGVEMADFDRDGWLDAVVLIKASGVAGLCPTPEGEEPFEVIDDEGEIDILFSPGDLEQITDGDAWQEVRLSRSQLPGRREVDFDEGKLFPEFNSYTGLTVGDYDGINGPDIVVAYNPVTCAFYGDEPPLNRIVLYANPGGVNTADPAIPELQVTADAGQDQAATIPSPGAVDPVGALVTLSAALSSATDFGPVNYFWEQAAGPAVVLAGANQVNPQFEAPIVSSALSFRVTVSAGAANDFDYVNVIVGDPGNFPPVVSATAPDVAIANADAPNSLSVTMTAFAFDPDGDALTYTWTQIQGESVTLTGENGPTPSFAIPEIGSDIRFRVTVSDGNYFDSALVEIAAGVWAPVPIERNLPNAGDVKTYDVDFDGDDDVVYTYPDAITSNVSWARNPNVGHGDGTDDGPQAVLDGANWQLRPVGQVDTLADVITLGDVDLDGFDDVLVRSRDGLVVQWFRHPGAADGEPIFPPPDVTPDRFNFPWQVYTMAEFAIGRPAGIAIGDMTGDGINEVAVAAGGVVVWFDSTVVPSVYDPWSANFVIDDTKANGATDDPLDPDFVDNGTVINSIAVVDLDGDGFGDMLGTLDRRVESGLSDDTLLWFRNTLGDSAQEVE